MLKESVVQTASLIFYLIDVQEGHLIVNFAKPRLQNISILIGNKSESHYNSLILVMIEAQNLAIVTVNWRVTHLPDLLY